VLRRYTDLYVGVLGSRGSAAGLLRFWCAGHEGVGPARGYSVVPGSSSSNRVVLTSTAVGTRRRRRAPACKSRAACTSQRKSRTSSTRVRLCARLPVDSSQASPFRAAAQLGSQPRSRPRAPGSPPRITGPSTAPSHAADTLTTGELAQCAHHFSQAGPPFCPLHTLTSATKHPPALVRPIPSIRQPQR
jgi:hypothetical protein